MTVSALTNAFTARLVLEAGHATGRKSYEGVAEAVGGRRWKVGCRLYWQQCGWPASHLAHDRSAGNLRYSPCQ